MESNSSDLSEYVHSQLIGSDRAIPTPFGNRRMLYVDYTASGRSLKCIEDYIEDQVLPFYGNTHTTSSQCGHQSTHFRSEARRTIHEAIGGNTHDVVLFTGSGATGAANKLVKCLQVEERTHLSYIHTEVSFTSGDADKTFSLSPQALRDFGQFEEDETIQNSFKLIDSLKYEKPIVFVGPYVHHSNLLPWREAGAEIVMIPEDPVQGGVDLCALQKALVHSWGAENDDMDSCMTVARQASAFDEQARFLVSQFTAATRTESSILPQVQLRRRRQLYATIARQKRLRIGAFSAASNVTGIVNPIDNITALLHTYGALAVWDYAAAAPHMPVIMNPLSLTPDFGIKYTKLTDLSEDESNKDSIKTDSNNSLCSKSSSYSTPDTVYIDWSRERLLHKDAVFFSMHKFIGGPGTPGILALKHWCLCTPAPSTSGGGTVFFVNAHGVPTYTELDEEREEGGTPDIIGAIRAGIVFHLHTYGMKWQNIVRREQFFARLVHERWSKHPNIRLLGSAAAPKLSIVSFEVLEPLGTSQPVPVMDEQPLVGMAHLRRRLHWSYIASLCNDLFGIQCRGGCLCAGPYAIRLLGLSDDDTDDLLDRLFHKQELLRPGFVRVAFPYHMPLVEANFIISAIEWIATYGIYLMPLYVPFTDTGEWKHRSLRQRPRPRSWLQTIHYSNGKMSWHPKLMTHHSFRYSDIAETDDTMVAASESEHRHRQAELERYPTVEVSGTDFGLYAQQCLEAANFALLEVATEDQLRHLKTSTGKWSSAAAKMRRAPGYTPLEMKKIHTTESATTEQSSVVNNTDLSEPISEATLNPAKGAVRAMQTKFPKLATEQSLGLLDEKSKKLRWFALPGDRDAAGQIALDISSINNKKETKAQHGNADAANGDAQNGHKLTENVDGATQLSTEQSQTGEKVAHPTAEYTQPVDDISHSRQDATSSSLTAAQLQLARSASSVCLPKDGSMRDQRSSLHFSSMPSFLSAINTLYGSNQPASTSALNSNDTSICSTATVLMTNDTVPSTSGNFTDSADNSTDDRVDATCSTQVSNGVDKAIQSEDISSGKTPSHSRDSPHITTASSSTIETQSKSVVQHATTGIALAARQMHSQSSHGAEQHSQKLMPSLQTYLNTIVAKENALKSSTRTISNQPTQQQMAATWAKPSKKMMRSLTSAINQYGMIQNGDRVMVALSGGKDSLSMLHMLVDFQKFSRAKFDICAMTVDPQAPGFDPSPLRAYLAQLGIPYYFESQPVIEAAKTHMTRDSICAWCSRMKRGIMYSTCRREKCNVLALGQHLDDLAESFIMSAFYNGILRTMKANYNNKEKDIRIIRPLIHFRERELASFAESAGLPVIADNCPACFNAPTERARTKLFLAAQEHEIPGLFHSLLRAMRPLIALSHADDRGPAGTSLQQQPNKNNINGTTCELNLSCGD